MEARTNEQEFEDWQIGGCHYKCQHCTDRIFSSSVMFWNHTKEDHGVLPKEYRDVYGNGRIKTAEITCAICNNIILHDFGKMKLHFLNKHQLELREYFDTFVKRADPWSALGEMETEISFNQIQYNSPMRKSANAASLWANRCSYQCKLCHFATKGKSQFNRHILRKHNLGIAKYRNLHGEFMAVTVQHKCQHCGKTLCHDYDDIRRHLSCHKLTLNDYYERYIATAATIEAEDIHGESGKQSQELENNNNNISQK